MKWDDRAGSGSGRASPGRVRVRVRRVRLIFRAPGEAIPGGPAGLIRPGRPGPGTAGAGSMFHGRISFAGSVSPAVRWRFAGGPPFPPRRTGPASPAGHVRAAPGTGTMGHRPARTGTMVHRAGPGRPGAGPPRGHLRGRRRQGHEALPRGTHLMLTPKEKCTQPGPSPALPSATGGGLAPETTHVRLCRRARTRHHSPMLPPFSSAIPLTRFLLLSVDDEGAKGRRRTTGSADAFR